jgi:tRNAThr (cytosine32-N3)-methyltransferase
MSEHCKRPQRNDPFGQRYLRDEEAVFDFNAWDNVDWPEEKDQEIREILTSQKACPVPEDEAFEIMHSPGKQWEDFYRTHDNKFFMDRKWLTREFPELFSQANYNYHQYL